MKTFWYVTIILSINFSIIVTGIRISKLNDFYQNKIDALEFQINAQRAYESELARRINILYEETGCVCKLGNNCNE